MCKYLMNNHEGKMRKEYGMKTKAIYSLIAVIIMLFLFTISCNLNLDYNFDKISSSEEDFLDIDRCLSNPNVSNTTIINNILTDIERGKIHRILRYLAHDIEWVVMGEAGKTPFAGTYEKKRKVEKYLRYFYRSIRLTDLVVESITETAENQIDSYIRLQGYIPTTRKTIDIEFLYTWIFNSKHQISQVTVSCITTSLELAFTRGGKGTVISTLQASPEAIAITNSYLPLKPLVLTAPIEFIRSFFVTPNDPPEGAIIESVNYGGVEGEITRTADSRNDKIILQMHGGAFYASNAGRFRIFNYAIASEIKIPVLSINFRLAPENPFHEGLDDCLTVYKELLKEYDPENIILEGESSGGNFVFALMLYAKQQNLPLPGAGIAISPWLDLTNSGETMVTNNDADTCLFKDYLDRCTNWYINGYSTESSSSAAAEDPLASPLFGDVTGFPPMYITIGASEVLLSDATTMFNKLTSKGVPVTVEMSSLVHAWPTACKGLIDSQRTIENFCNFLRDKLNIE